MPCFINPWPAGKLVGNRRLIILTHHEGFDLKGQLLSPLWSQFIGALGREPDYWYWVHAHNVVVYRQRGKPLCRCVGCGAIAYGRAADLADARAVEWFEA